MLSELNTYLHQIPVVDRMFSLITRKQQDNPHTHDKRSHSRLVSVLSEVIKVR